MPLLRPDDVLSTAPPGTKLRVMMKPNMTQQSQEYSPDVLWQPHIRDDADMSEVIKGVGCLEVLLMSYICVIQRKTLRNTVVIKDWLFTEYLADIMNKISRPYYYLTSDTTCEEARYPKYSIQRVSALLEALDTTTSDDGIKRYQAVVKAVEWARCLDEKVLKDVLWDPVRAAIRQYYADQAEKPVGLTVTLTAKEATRRMILSDILVSEAEAEGFMDTNGKELFFLYWLIENEPRPYIVGF
jgi:hypothetical protein